MKTRLLLLVFVVVGAASCAVPPTALGCEVDADCVDGAVCAAGLCVGEGEGEGESVVGEGEGEEGEGEGDVGEGEGEGEEGEGEGDVGEGEGDIGEGEGEGDVGEGEGDVGEGEGEGDVGEGEGEGEGEGDGEGEGEVFPPLLGTGSSVGLDEDSSTTITLTATGGDRSPITWRVAGADATSVVVLTGDRLSYAGGANVGDVVDDVTVTPSQNGIEGASAVISFVITAVNDLPRLELVGGGDVVIGEDASFAADFVDADDVDGDAVGLSLRFDGPAPDPALFSSFPAVDAAGRLSFVPAPNRSGFTVSGAVVANDGGGQTVEVPFTLTVTAVDDDPQLTVRAVSLLEDGPADVALVVAADGGPEEGDDVVTVTVELDTADSLVLRSVSRNADGTFRVVPVGDANGSVVVDVVATDLGNHRVVRPATVRVDAVNDPATFTVPAGKVVITEDVTGVVNGFATNIVPGPAEEADDSVAFDVVINSGSDLIASASVDASGRLTVVPAPNQNGDAQITITILDPDVGDVVVVDIGVTAVNDPPSLTLVGAAPTLIEDTAFSSTPIVTARSPGGGPDEAAEVVSVDVDVVSGGGNLLGVVGVDGTGALTGALRANRFGSFTLRFTPRDGGGNGIAQELTFTVTGVNDAPEVAPRALAFSEDVAVDGVLADLTPGPGGESGTLTLSNVSFTDASDVIDEALTVVSLVGNNTVHVTPRLKQDKNGSFSVTFTVSDGGAAPNSTTTTASVTVTPVNDPPTLRAPLVFAALQGKSHASTFTVVDVDGDNVIVSVAGTPTNTTLSVDNTLDTWTFSAGTSGVVNGTANLLLFDGTVTVAVNVPARVIGVQRSCFHIRAQRAQLADGAAGSAVYDLNDGTAYQAFCDMQNDGGGWTLVMKIDGNDDEFDFDDTRWTNATLLAEDAANAPDLVGGNTSGAWESKLQSYLSVKVDELRVGFAPRTSGTRAFTFVSPSLVVGGPAASMQALMSANSSAFVSITAPSKAQWLAADAAFALDTNCDRRGINVREDGGAITGAEPRVRIGILSNGEGNCDSPDTFVGVGGANANGVAGSRNQDRYAAVLVRSTDLTELREADTSTFDSCAEVLAAGFLDANAIYNVNGTSTVCAP